ncbi:hypothetical protein Tcur_1767 [Thermomonospora curvata DSM 43183]|uniref:Uncharacterized protein n=3 Tax=Actinomycetes TaxID=1760 RepID=D1AC75_THECD|nr:hypothetical protein Tcur_1767 [Thermomonospora curvata DSM 43183]PZM89138.1 MAG: hypothetical protein DIU77_19495 [Thermocrispum agreste]
MLEAVLSERNRRKVVAVSAATASMLVMAMAGGTVIWAAGAGQERADGLRLNAAAQRAPAPAPSSSPDLGPMPAAKAFLQAKDPERKVSRHVEDVRRSGSYLRVYTDLKERDANSRSAISLCEWTVEYLRRHLGELEPVVFVHAGESDNGHVVLANKQSADDDCRVGKTP